tara:strand:- start:268 stop:864 length:597 start_codon:yes stop_codon:yes gene_type:complete
MEKIISVEGLDKCIYDHLTFRDLRNLRKVSSSLCNSIHYFSLIIITYLIESYNQSYEVSYKWAELHYTTELIYKILYKCYKEIDFIKNFIKDRKTYNAFMTTIKETEFIYLMDSDDYGSNENTTKQLKMCNNYYEMMYIIEKEEKENYELDKKISSEGYQKWKKKDGKWVIDSITPLEDINPPLIDRSVLIYNLKIKR